jgi:predicted nucleic acid-binding protein
MTDYLLDSGILIRHLRGYKGYPELVERLTDEADICISVMTRFEVVRGMRDHERVTTFNLLESLDTIVVSNEIADTAGELVRSCRAKGITLGEADALVAATAMQHNLALVTTNAKHFSMHKMIVFEADDKGKLTLCE